MKPPLRSDLCHVSLIALQDCDLPQSIAAVGALFRSVHLTQGVTLGYYIITLSGFEAVQLFRYQDSPICFLLTQFANCQLSSMLQCVNARMRELKNA